MKTMRSATNVGKAFFCLALTVVFAAGTAAAAPNRGTIPPPANSLATERMRKLSAPASGEPEPDFRETVVVRNVSFQRYKP